EETIVIEVPNCCGSWACTSLEIVFGLEASISIPQEDRNAVRGLVNGGQIHLAVTIKVASHNKLRANSGRQRRAGDKVRISLIQQNRNGSICPVCNGQIHESITVEVCRHH